MSAECFAVVLPDSQVVGKKKSRRSSRKEKNGRRLMLQGAKGKDGVTVST
jgi:hypothetical protein